MSASLRLDPTLEKVVDEASARTPPGRGARDRGQLAARRPDAPEAHHRAFVRWALALTLLFGAGWGAHLLFEIGLAGRFDAVSGSDVVAALCARQNRQPHARMVHPSGLTADS